MIVSVLLFLCGLLTYQMGSAHVMTINEQTANGLVQGFPTGSAPGMLGIVERLISHPHRGFPKLSYKNGDEALVAKLMFPGETI